MRKGHGKAFIPRESKPSADKRKKAMYERFKRYKPECLFVVDAEGHSCKKQTVASHTIPRANVLEPMQGPDNKVLVTSWGVGALSHLFMSSSEESPIDLTREHSNLVHKELIAPVPGNSPVSVMNMVFSTLLMLLNRISTIRKFSS